MRCRRGWFAWVMGLSLALAGPAHALVWVEGPGDAGDTLASAQLTIGKRDLTSIAGHLDFDVNTLSYDVDLFGIKITVPTLFSASTRAGGARITDPALYLFDSSGHGVYMNDDQSDSNLQSALPAGNVSGPLAPGMYFLAVAFAGFDPFSALGSIFPLYEAFPPLASSGVYGPTGSGGSAGLEGWNPGGSLRPDLPQRYIIDLTAVSSALPEPATLLLTLVGVFAIGGSRSRSSAA